MLKINFVPDDYIQKQVSLRTNRLYLVLFLLVMSVLAGIFTVLKTRERVVAANTGQINQRMVKANEAIKQLEELELKRKTMMRAALATAELIEPVPRSVILASLTNNLPAGTSLGRLKLVQKEPKIAVQTAAARSQYDAKKAALKDQETKISQEKSLETDIEIEGIAPSNIQVANYIERLAGSVLFEDVTLVHSKERKIDDEVLLEFKLMCRLKKDIQLSSEDVAAIRAEYLKKM